MKVLITGATGFLGGMLARSLVKRGWEVTGSGRNQTIGAELIKNGIRFVPADLADQDSVVALCQGQDVVVHCAGLSSVWGARAAFEQANILGTAHVIAGCQIKQVSRLVHISTPSLYFNGPSRLNVKEDDPLPSRPINLYVWSKLEAEQLVNEAQRGGLSTIVLRPRGIYGAGDQALIPRIVRALETGRLRVIGDGENIQNLTNVQNVVCAIELAIEAGTRFGGSIYNVTDGEAIKIWSVIEQIGTLIGHPLRDGRLSTAWALRAAQILEGGHRLFRLSREPILTRYSVQVLSSSQTLDISAIQHDLGYRPLINTQTGIEQTLADLKRRGRISH